MTAFFRLRCRPVHSCGRVVAVAFAVNVWSVFVLNAWATCSTSGDGLTRTCDGAVNAPDSFNHLNAGAQQEYRYVIEKLTNASFSGTGITLLQMLASGRSFSDRNNGVSVGTQSFSLNEDGGVNLFSLSATNGVALDIQQTGGSGGSSGENKGSGKRSGAAGASGGVAGTLEANLNGVSITASNGKPLVLVANGGHGGAGAEGYSTGFGDGYGGGGGTGSSGGNLTVALDNVRASNSNGGTLSVVQITATGGQGAHGGEGKAADYTGGGGGGGRGGSGGFFALGLTGGLSISAETATGLIMGGYGGSAGTGGTGTNTLTGTARGGSGGMGGGGGNINVRSTDDSAVTISAGGRGAMVLESIAGDGGTGGYASGGGSSYGGNGGSGGLGGSVTVALVDNLLALTTTAAQAQGLFARSYGGAGGGGGDGKGTFIVKGKGGSGAGSGPGGKMDVTFNGSISTAGEEANALIVQSVGGFSGDGGSGSGFVAYGAGSESAGGGGDATVVWTGPADSSINTLGDHSDAIFVQSQGGGGGKGGKASGIKALAGSGSSGGSGGTVQVTTSGASMTTGGLNAVGLFAQSTGGGGGAGGGSSAIDAVGGSGGGGGKGGAVTVMNSSAITTTGDFSDGVYVESLGGGGGRVTSSSGIVSVGGGGGSGASGAEVMVFNSGSVTTSGAESDALFAHSYGGGGGKGAASTAIGVGFSLAHGGNGGSGNDGGKVTVNQTGNSAGWLRTSGTGARGLVAHSQGAGGGHAGNILSVSGGAFDVGIAIGGRGGAAGNGGAVVVAFDGGVSTQGDYATGILATSSGGGGGSAGTTLAVGASLATFSTAVGGNASGGGNGGDVMLCRGDSGSSLTYCSGPSAQDARTVTTAGEAAHGVVASSIGGGGGHSGAVLAGGASPSIAGVDVSVGGSGGGGGMGGAIQVFSSGGIETKGSGAIGLLAKSVGGSGGTAYTSVAADAGAIASTNVSVGGTGGSAGGGGDVAVTSTDTIVTTGASADGMLALSSGKSGGVGGAAISGSGVNIVNAGVAVGGGAGGGGTSGTVTLDWHGAAITTSGEQAVGIYASSTAGSGGRGGLDVNGAVGAVASGQVSVGGKGGTGGRAAAVSVATSNITSSITTFGSQAPGIEATSLGGDGGRGGLSVSSTLASQGSASVTVGGGGGSGGSASTVTVDNAGSITTNGTHSAALLALSQGGAGGNGGAVVEGGFDSGGSDGAPAGDIAVNVGGSGGGGGQAGQVSVTHSGMLQTNNFASYGVSAQSTGGQGGNGGAVYSGQANFATVTAVNINVDVGGDGGAGAKTGAVEVSNSGSIITAQDASYAVFAQSIGGSGGTGGNSYNMLANLAAQGGSSASFQVTVGGKGGKASIGNTVNVTNTGTLTTHGNSAPAVYAQSIGGNGGNGGAGGNILLNAGQTSSDSNVTTVTADIAVGGSGGTGADGGAVIVNNNSGGTILTTGSASSHGVFAQSVGGGGGDGGAASGYTLSITGACSISGAKTFVSSCRQSNGNTKRTSWGLNVNVGGSGGAAGTGGTVTVAGQEGSAISTSGEVSHAIMAQSIGGGGGVGGSASTGLGAFTSNKVATGIAKVLADATKLDPYSALKSWTSLGVSVGGKGGANGDGGAVNLSRVDGNLSTEGDGSYAIFAQSIGGGGGSGGAATSSPVHSFSVGGSGTSGGNGGPVTVEPSAITITTKGTASYGVFAQSVGGGGGDGGNRKAPVVNPQLAIQVGGGTGASGNGGTVLYAGVAAITTDGEGASALFAQSVGGGGGKADGGLNGGQGTVFVGGSGSASGNGGGVDLTSNGNLTTAKKASNDTVDVAAFGIFAQSVGGGGGLAGSIIVGAIDNFGSALAMGADSSAKGDGGDVSVAASGDMLTTGGASMGIFAQSVGGGGGVQGQPDRGSQSGVLIGSGRGSGTAGRVSVVVVDNGQYGIATSGPGAHGIFAQSAGGVGTSTSTENKVSVTVQNSVIASGPGAFGIFAQSVGDGRGSIAVTVAANVNVGGGAAATIAGASDGIGVVVADGTVATLDNSGFITTALVDNGVAVSALRTSLTINNMGGGYILGKICKNGTCTNPSGAEPSLSSGDRRTTPSTRIVVNNAPNGRLALGERYQVDELHNFGRMEIVGAGEQSVTHHDGDLIHGEGGIIIFDVDAAQNTSDRLEVGGDSELAGDIDIRITNAGTATGEQRVTLIRGAGEISRPDQAQPSVPGYAVLDYQLDYARSGQVDLRYTIAYDNADVAAVASANQRSVARYLQSSFATAPLPSELDDVLTFTDMSDYLATLSSLSPQVYADNQLSSLYSSMAFGDALLSCAQREGSYRYIDEGQCGWLDVEGRKLARDSSHSSAGFEEDSWQLAGGVQVQLNQGWIVGAALSYEERNLEQDGNAGNSDGYQWQLGGVLKRPMAATVWSASLALGYADFDTERAVHGGRRADGDQQLWLVSTQLRAAHLFDYDSWYLTPRVDLGVEYQSDADISEQGADGLTLAVDGKDETYVYVEPAVEVGGDIAVGEESIVRPRLTLGVTRFLTDAAPEVTASFVGSGSSFATRSELDRTYVDAELGLDIFTASAVTLSLSANGRFSDNTDSYAGKVTFAVPF